jgi:hypothetical protein
MIISSDLYSIQIEIIIVFDDSKIKYVYILIIFVCFKLIIRLLYKICDDHLSNIIVYNIYFKLKIAFVTETSLFIPYKLVYIFTQIERFNSIQ